MNVGDRVHVVLTNGDEATFTIARSTPHWLGSEGNSYSVDSIESVEVLPPKGDGVYRDKDGEWCLSCPDCYNRDAHHVNPPCGKVHDCEVCQANREEEGMTND